MREGFRPFARRPSGGGAVEQRRLRGFALERAQSARNTDGRAVFPAALPRARPRHRVQIGKFRTVRRYVAQAHGDSRRSVWRHRAVFHRRGVRVSARWHGFSRFRQNGARRGSPADRHPVRRRFCADQNPRKDRQPHREKNRGRRFHNAGGRARNPRENSRFGSLGRRKAARPEARARQDTDSARPRRMPRRKAAQEVRGDSRTHGAGIVGDALRRRFARFGRTISKHRVFEVLRRTRGGF